MIAAAIRRCGPQMTEMVRAAIAASGRPEGWTHVLILRGANQSFGCAIITRYATGALLAFMSMCRSGRNSHNIGTPFRPYMALSAEQSL